MLRKAMVSITAVAFVLMLNACASTGSSSASAGVKPYLKKTCIVSGNKLGSMGIPVRMVREGQEIKFCCKPCVKKFNTNPGKYLAKLK